MGRKAGSFYWVKNKEQRRNKKEISDWLGHIANLVWSEKGKG